jgi:hypothetical protein
MGRRLPHALLPVLLAPPLRLRLPLLRKVRPQPLDLLHQQKNRLHHVIFAGLQLQFLPRRPSHNKPPQVDEPPLSGPAALTSKTIGTPNPHPILHRRSRSPPYPEPMNDTTPKPATRLAAAVARLTTDDDSEPRTAHFNSSL